MILLSLFLVHLLISVVVIEAIPQGHTTKSNQALDNDQLYIIIRDLKKTTTSLQERVDHITSLEEKVEHLSVSYETLKKEREDDKALLLKQQHTIKKLKLQLKNQGSDIDVLRTRISKTETDHQLNTNASHMVTSYQQTTDNSEYQELTSAPKIPDSLGLNNTQQQSTYRVAEIPKQVPKSAFYARAQRGVAVSDDEVIKFEDVVLNIGNNFDQQYSVFTCTIPGTYVFTHHVFTYPEQKLQNVIVKNGDKVAWVDGKDAVTYGAATTSCIINLDERDRVWVKVDGTVHRSGTVIYPQFTSFSGFLLYPIY